MHTVTIFPLGNADCTRINLANGRRVLVDFANKKDPNDADDKRCDLPALLREDLEKVDADFYDRVAITHLDDDHYKGFSDFFWLEHDKKYQGKDRIKITELWVPAAVITEDDLEKDEAKVVQAEARYRLQQGTGVLVFSRPNRMKEWCENNGIDFDTRKDLFIDAGKTVPGFELAADGVEFFVHSPFAKRLNDEEVEDRNNDAISMQVCFSVDGTITKMHLWSDLGYQMLEDIVDITKKRGRVERLEWDIVKLPHHCSYLSLGPNKEEDKTTPVENVSWLYEQASQDRCTVISTSKIIPKKGTDEDKDDNPPHRQAAKYYEDVTEEKRGEFIVSMEHPDEDDPEPIVIEISGTGKKVIKRSLFGAAAITSTRAERAGNE